MIQLIRSAVLLFLAALLAACGGGGGGGGDGGAERPQAYASADTVEVYAGEDTVYLDGSASTSANGAIRSWQWRFLSQPEGSNAVLDGADSEQASFIPDLPGQYVVQLVVTDDEATSADTEDSRVTITALNPYPTAVVPEEINWILGTVQLDGSQSLPPDGGDADLLTYEWSLIEKPDGSAATLDDPTLIYPRFEADQPGLYRASLVVHYGDRSSEADTVDIRIVEANAAPIPVITVQPEPVMLGDTVSLDGSASEDANGDPLQYRWRLLSTPMGSTAQLSSTTEVQTGFVADSRDGQGRYTVELCVFDGIARSCSEQRIEVGLPETATNTAPVAVITPGSNFTHEVERGVEVTIRGGDSYDLDGDSLTYDWSLVAHPDGYSPDADDTLQGILFYCSLGFSPCTSMEFLPTVDGDYTWQLTVSDGTHTSVTSETFTAMLGANRPPEAVASTTTGNRTVMVGQQVTLDGAESSDPDDNQLTYQWTLIQRPDNSSAELQNADTWNPTFTADAPGPYVVTLVVTDEHGASSGYSPGNSNQEVVVLAKSSNNPPITRITRSWYGSSGSTDTAFGPDQPFLLSHILRDYDSADADMPDQRRMDTFSLIADSYDPDGDELTHLWVVREAPADNEFGFVAGGSTCDFYGTGNEEACDRITVAPTAGGTYVFDYQVYDGSEFAGPYTVTVYAEERHEYPGLLLEVFSSFTYNTIPGEGQPYSFIPSDSYLSQQFFPYTEVLEGRTGAPGSGIAGDLVNPITMNHVAYLTASGGDYTFDVATGSDDARYRPRLVDITREQEITSGYVLPQGESAWIMAQVEIPDSELPQTDPSQAEALAESLNAAGLYWTLTVRERPEWQIEYRAEFDDGPVLLPSELDFSIISP